MPVGEEVLGLWCGQSTGQFRSWINRRTPCCYGVTEDLIAVLPDLARNFSSEPRFSISRKTSSISRGRISATGRLPITGKNILLPAPPERFLRSFPTMRYTYAYTTPWRVP